MKFILLFGPQAVGKMTVGQELEKITGLILFHNHMTIDLLVPLFGYSPEMWRLCHLIRREIFRAAAKSSLYGMIFTTVWAFNSAEDWAHVKEVSDIFRSAGADIYFVELEADADVRLKRNRTPNRLEHKPTKRDTETSEKDLLDSMKKYRLNSSEGEIKEKNYLRLNNTSLSAAEAAQRIKRAFRI